MNGIVLLFLFPLLLYYLGNIGSSLFQWNPTALFLYGNAAGFLYAASSLMLYSRPVLKRIAPETTNPVWRLIPLAVPLANLCWLLFGILEPARRSGALPERAGRYVRVSGILLAALTILCIVDFRTPEFIAVELIFALLLCRTLYLSIKYSAQEPEEAGSPALALVLSSTLFFLYCTTLTITLLATHAITSIQGKIAAEAGFSYDSASLNTLYRKRCPVTNAEFDRRMRNPEPGDDIFEKYPELTLRLPFGLNRVMGPAPSPELERFFAAHAPFLRRIDDWSMLPALGLNVDIRDHHPMDERNVFLNWARLHMLRAELAIAGGDKAGALRYWHLLRNVRNFIRNMPDQPSDFIASSMEPMRRKLLDDMKAIFPFTQAELRAFQTELARDRDDYETSRKIVLFRESLAYYPPGTVSLTTVLLPFNGPELRKDRDDLNAILSFQKNPESSGTLHRKAPAALVRQMKGKRAGNLAALL